MQMLPCVGIHSLFGVKHQEEHTETVKGRYEYTNHNRKIGYTGTRYMRLRNRFNNGIFGKESGKAGESDQGQRSD